MRERGKEGRSEGGRIQGERCLKRSEGGRKEGGQWSSEIEK